MLALLAVFFTALRLTLPMVAEKKSEIEAYLSHKTMHRISIETLDAHWDGLHPGLRIRGLQVFPLDRLRPAMELSEVRISIALLPLLWREFEISTLAVTRPRLALERLSDGRFRVSGFGPVTPTPGAGGDEFIGWLFKQNNLVIENGELQWFDHQDTVAALHLSNVNLTLKNRGEQHRLGASAAFPPGICGDCSIVADVRGNPLLGKNWHGEIYVKAHGLRVHELPKVIREILPGEPHGAINAQLWTEWDAGRPESVRGRFDVDGLRAISTQLAQPISVRQMRADVSWATRSDGWRLDLANFELGLSGPSWSVDRMRIVRRAEDSTIQAKHLELDDISGFIEGVKTQNEFVRMWAALNPGGAVDQFKLRVTGPLFDPLAFSVEARVESLRSSPLGRFPGFRNVSGWLAADTDSGKFDLAARHLVLEMPRIFRAPLRADEAVGRVSWRRHPEDWEVLGDGLRVSGEDGEADGKLVMRIPHGAPSVPHMKLRADFRNGKGEKAARYYPVKQLPPRTLAWMEKSFLGGTITSGHLVYDGRIDNFPFDDGNGKFEVRAHVRDGAYEFLPGWMPIRAAEVDIVVDGRKVLVTGGGKIGGLDLVHAVVRTERDAASGKTRVHASGRARGPISETLAVLRDVKPRGRPLQWKRYLPLGLRAAGDGVLNMDLKIPTDRPMDTQFSGEYRLSQGVLGFARLGTVLQSIEGVARFSEHGPEGGSLTARFLDGDSVIAIVRGEQREHPSWLTEGFRLRDWRRWEISISPSTFPAILIGQPAGV